MAKVSPATHRWKAGSYLDRLPLGQAEEFLQLSLSAARKANKNMLLHTAYSRLQLLVQRQLRTDSVLLYADSALLYAQPKQKIKIFHNLGSYFEKEQGDPSTAEPYYLRAIDVADSLAFPIGKRNSMINLALLRSDDGRIKTGLRLFEEALAIEGSEPFDFTPAMFRRAALMYEANGNLRESVLYFKSGLLTQDSILTTQRVALLKLNAFERQSKDLKIARQDDALIYSEARRNWQRRIISLLLLVTLIVAGGLWIILRQKRKLSLVNEQLNLMTDEVHHRVKNDFQSLASMLFVRLHEMPSGDLKTALDKVRSRLLQLSDVHASLQTTQVMEGNTLLSRLKEIATHFPATVSVEVTLPARKDVSLTPLQTQQLAVILVELVNNAQKHGPDSEAPVILSVKEDAGCSACLSVTSPSSSNSKTSTGSGFGLNLIRTICQQQGWRFEQITAEQEFVATVRIPEADADAIPIP